MYVWLDWFRICILERKPKSFVTFVTQFYRYKTLFVHHLCINGQKFCTELGISANLDRARRALNHGWVAPHFWLIHTTTTPNHHLPVPSTPFLSHTHDHNPKSSFARTQHPIFESNTRPRPQIVIQNYPVSHFGSYTQPRPQSTLGVCMNACMCTRACVL